MLFRSSNGSVVYQEQTNSSGSVVGSYLRYTGAAVQWAASDLASSLSQGSQWLAAAGPLLEVFNPSQSSQGFRLFSSPEAPFQLPGASLSSLSAATPVLSVDAPWTRFNPAQAINPSNSSLYLPGLNARTGEIVSYYVDPTPQTLNRPLVKQVNPGDAVAGSNLWTNVNLGPAQLQGAPVVNGAPLVQARYVSGFSNLVESPPAGTATSLPQVSQGQTLYLQPSSDGNGVLVYLDAAAQQPLTFSGGATSTGQDYLLMTLTNWQQQNTPVHGLTNRDQVQLISLGNDYYQVVNPGIDFARALPVQLFADQVTAGTTLSTQAPNPSTTPGIAGGVMLNAAIDAKNRTVTLARSERLPTPTANAKWLNTFAEKAKAHTTSRDKIVTALVGTTVQGEILPKFGLTPTQANQTTNATWGVVGALSINQANQVAQVNLASTAQIEAAGDVGINSTVFELDHTGAIAEMMLESAKFSLAIAAANTAINSQATNSIGGTISSQGSVNPTASVVNPSATWFPLVSIASAYSSADSGTTSKKKKVDTTLANLTKAIIKEIGRAHV